MNRGNRKGIIFVDDCDRREFLRTSLQEQETHGVIMLGQTLMGNHFHAGVVTPHGNLSEFMEQLQGRYARYFNRRHGYVGHVFQRRFRHVCIEGDIHLLTMLCYLFMNPVTAGFVSQLEHYEWSTYRATAGFAPVPGYLCLEWLAALYPSLPLPEAQLRFRRLMSEAKPVAAYINSLELNVDGETINQVVRSYTGEQLHVASLPRVYRTALRPTLTALLQQVHGDRSLFVKDGRVTYGYKNADIGRALGVSPNTVSRIFSDDRRSRERLIRCAAIPELGIAPNLLLR